VTWKSAVLYFGKRYFVLLKIFIAVLVIFAVHICGVENCSKILIDFCHSTRYFITEDSNLMRCIATTGSPVCGGGTSPFSFAAEQSVWRLGYGLDSRGTVVLFPSAEREFSRCNQARL
jgi:hypothetical protein